MTENEKSLYDKAIKKWGVDSQVYMDEQLAIIFDENIVKLEKNNKLLRLQKRVNNGRTKI